MVLGRPRKYGSDMAPINLYVPAMYADAFRDEAANLRVSVNEYVNGLLAASDKELASQLIKNMTAMREEIKANADRLEKTHAELLGFKDRAGNALEYLTATVQEDKELADLIMQVVARQQKTYLGLVKNGHNKEAIQVATENAYADLELLLLKENRIAKKPALFKNLIRMRLSKLEVRA